MKSGLIKSRTSDVPAGNVVNLAVYIEAQCPDTSRFVHRQLLPAWQELSITNRISIKIVPFGKAKCSPVGSDYSCECQHGPLECELNELMNCVIEMVGNPREYVPVISCIQGKRDLRSAGLKCLSKLRIPNKRILQCAEGEEGRKLLAKAGEETEHLLPPLNFVPWILINGTRSSDAFYDLKKNLCDALDPVPDQCKEQQ
uniref:Gamma interferon inducible lysosomal thiol reductase n=1 Tax=Elaeophora elaphi TaxID=1147741 RepID=A0A0R3RSY6_9BILA